MSDKTLISSTQSADSDGNNVRDADTYAPGLADRLRRALRGKSRAEISEASGVSNSTIARVLAGRSIRRGNLVSLAEALGVRIEWLAQNEGPMRASSSNVPSLVPAGWDQEDIEKLRGLPHHQRWKLAEDAIDIQRLGKAIEMAESGNPSLAELRKEGPIQNSMAFMHASNVLAFYRKLTREAGAAPPEPEDV